MTPALPFPSLPEQRAPDVICTDRHTLEQCRECVGKGHVERVRCEICNGAGRIIRAFSP